MFGKSDFDSARREFEKKFKDKTGLSWDDRLEPPKFGKYVFIKLSYEPYSDEDKEDDDAEAGASRSKNFEPQATQAEVPGILSIQIQHLMELIFNS